MTRRRLDLSEHLAVAVVGSVRRVRAHRLAASVIGLVAILAAGSGYLTIGALDFDPFDSPYRVRVELDQSGGLLPGQDVTLRGVRVGRVASVEVDGDTVTAVAAIDSHVRIPDNGEVRAAALSAAGEQYLDFLPETDSGPFLTDGATVHPDRTSAPIPMARMLEKLSGTLVQVDPRKLHDISTELGVSAEGPDKLADIVNGGIFMISTLDGVLPQTVSLIRNSKVVLGTLDDGAPALRRTAEDLSATLGGVTQMSGGFEQLVNRAPETFTTMDAIIAQNSPTMVQLLGNLTTVGQMTRLRVPAFREFFFPQQRAGSTIDAITSAIHDDGVWALVSIYPRYQCDYDVPRRPGSVPNFPAPYLYSDCTDPDPTLLPRGARNAPRPPGWNASVLPPGADPHATADPPPTGKYSIPTPFGGADAPNYIPPN
ncbi:MlaD family protein [Nocardia bovistercoris]|uniref:MCE family protein n=1 Tax=Nocardia bovistercoris TaxID=2785916 RepID=A0A931I9S5_9NOCA|nr:MlaD family protein [Nocardia bovistercoris]MBH0776312.1 MCE family protein [Nocardia bovistercoris]